MQRRRLSGYPAIATERSASVLASHARRYDPPPAQTAAPPARATERRQPRQPVEIGLAGRRYIVHLFCLALVCLASVGPLAATSGVGDRASVHEAVERHGRFLMAQAEMEAPGGWTTPRIPMTIAEVDATRPADLELPAAPANFVRSPETTAPVTAAGPAANPAPAARSVSAPVVSERAPLQAATREALQRRFATVSDAYGFMVLDADGATLYEHQADQVFQAASLYKLGVAAEVYRQARAGKLNFRDTLVITRESLAESDMMFVAPRDVGRKITVAEALDFMITRSSNAAAHLLLKRVGPANVNALMSELGLKNTLLLDRPFGNVQGNAKNQTTPRDIARFFSLLLHGKVVDVESSEAIIRLLLRQKIDDRLPAELPSGVLVAHKTGNLVGAAHDAGIIYTPAGPLIVVGMSQDYESETEAYAMIARLSRVAYEAFTGTEQVNLPLDAR